MRPYRTIHDLPSLIKILKLFVFFGRRLSQSPFPANDPKFGSKTDANKSNRGQMSIEFAVMFPVMLLVALIAFNCIMLLAQCSAFDRIFRESVCTYAPSPASDQGSAQICANIASELETFQEKDYLNCSVSSSELSSGMTKYLGTLSYTPTVFGAYPLRQVFGVSLPPIDHVVQITVDSYKPGVFL